MINDHCFTYDVLVLDFFVLRVNETVSCRIEFFLEAMQVESSYVNECNVYLLIFNIVLTMN